MKEISAQEKNEQEWKEFFTMRRLEETLKGGGECKILPPGNCLVNSLLHRWKWQVINYREG